jgi:ATP adenylyltransferase
LPCLQRGRPGREDRRRRALVVEHCIGPLGVGTLIVKPRRHVLHGPVHIHFVVQPEPDGEPHGPRLQVAMFDQGELPDADEAAAFAERARAVLG